MINYNQKNRCDNLQKLNQRICRKISTTFKLKRDGGILLKRFGRQNFLLKVRHKTHTRIFSLIEVMNSCFKQMEELDTVFIPSDLLPSAALYSFHLKQAPPNYGPQKRSGAYSNTSLVWTEFTVPQGSLSTLPPIIPKHVTFQPLLCCVIPAGFAPADATGQWHV